MAHACRIAKDQDLGFIFYTIMNSIGNDYSCGGIAAISEGETFVTDLLTKIQRITLRIDDESRVQFAIFLIADKVKNADFTGILKFQESQLKNGTPGVTKEGIEAVQKMLIDSFEEYRKYPSIREII